jgi:phage terminase small subunit
MSSKEMEILTPRERRFVYEYMKDKNGKAAASRAGYQGSDNTLKVTASRMLDKPHIVKEIRTLQSKELERAIVTKDSVIDMLQETILEARAAGKYEPAVKGIIALAEMVGGSLKKRNGTIIDVAPEDAFSNGDSNDEFDLSVDIKRFLEMAIPKKPEFQKVRKAKKSKVGVEIELIKN